MAYYLIHTPLQAVPEMVDKYGGRRRNRWAICASMVEKMDEVLEKSFPSSTLKAYATTPWCCSVPTMVHTLISLAKRHTALVKKGSYFEAAFGALSSSVAWASGSWRRLVMCQ